MYDAGKIITGLVIFIGLVTLPVWSGIGGSSAAPTPVIKAELKGTSCVEDTDFMRSRHMQLLNDWRNEVVREGKRTYTNKAGKKFEKSLSNTCMDCHSNKTEFCDSCHNYASVDPFCWDCHVAPKENK